MLYVNLYYVDRISKKVGWWQTYICFSKEEAIDKLNRVHNSIKKGTKKHIGSFSAVIEETKGCIAFH